MRWLLYNLLFTLGFLVLLPRFLYRMARRGGYARGFLQRFGRYAPELRRRLAEGPRTWVHAVSVGEVYVALGLVREMRRRQPGARFILSVTTSTGHAVAAAALDPRDVLVYFPLDVPPAVRRALRRLRPAALVLVECELWPNLLRQARAAGIPVALVNGRISEHSFRGYRRLTLFTRPLLREAGLLCVQSEADRQRLEALGAPPERLHVMGSAKYETVAVDAERGRQARETLREAGWNDACTVLAGGSTWPGEEDALQDAVDRLRRDAPGLRLLLAPRHAERGDAVAAAAAARGARVRRRSGGEAVRDPDVFLLDTTGELRHFYAAADLIFVGKSLTQHGGQNIIEAAACGKPVLCGPNMENFPVVMADFREADAVVQVRDAKALYEALALLVRDPGRRAAYGRRAAELVQRRAGALARTVDLLNANGIGGPGPAGRQGGTGP